MIPFLELQKVNLKYKSEINESITRVFDSSWYKLGNDVKSFEQEFTQFIETKHRRAVAKGLDALIQIIRVYKEMGLLTNGDEIIVPANTYIATILAITQNKLTAILVETVSNTFNIFCTKIVQKTTKAMIPVHLYDQKTEKNAIASIAIKHNLKIIEENAQAHGAINKGNEVGSWGEASGFSFYPSNNVVTLGDRGNIKTNDDELIQTCRFTRKYGAKKKQETFYNGVNSRLDEIQNAILKVILSNLDGNIQERRDIASYNIENIKNMEIGLPILSNIPDSYVWHLFVIRTTKRTMLQQFLTENTIQTVIHYPRLPHKQACYKEWNNQTFPITEQIANEVLNLPKSPIQTIELKKQIVPIIN